MHLRNCLGDLGNISKDNVIKSRRHTSRKPITAVGKPLAVTIDSGIVTDVWFGFCAFFLEPLDFGLCFGSDMSGDCRMFLGIYSLCSTMTMSSISILLPGSKCARSVPLEKSYFQSVLEDILREGTGIGTYMAIISEPVDERRLLTFHNMPIIR